MHAMILRYLTTIHCFSCIVFLEDQNYVILAKDGRQIDTVLPKEWNEAITERPSILRASDIENWQNDELQFARLIAECEAAGYFMNTEPLELSMDLKSEEICEIIDRAQGKFEKWTSLVK